MAPGSSREITILLRAWAGGDPAALEQLMPLVYGTLRRMARRRMRREQPGNLLQPTALVNEAYVKLAEAGPINWQDRAHFFAVSAQVMRRILVGSARSRLAKKRGGGAADVDLDVSIDGLRERGRELIRLDDALETLAKFDPRKARVVEMKFFGGLSVTETAEVLKISPRSVMRDWNLARAWLVRELGG
jgi:RNA polymerase sigma factor (TIGR02999 family)